MAGGRRIDDHSAWMGSSSSESILPMGVKMKSERDVEGAGKLSEYCDTSEAISGSQSKSVSMIRGNSPKTGYRH